MKPLTVALSRGFGAWAGGAFLFLHAILGYTLEYHISLIAGLNLRAATFGLPFEVLSLGTLFVILTTCFPLLIAAWTAVTVDLEPKVFKGTTSNTGYFLCFMAARLLFPLVRYCVKTAAPLHSEKLMFTLSETILVLIAVPFIRSLFYFCTK